MFQLVCMFMHFKPGDAEGVAEKIFSKVMAVGDVFRHFKPQLGQLDFFGTVDFDQPIPLHPAHSRVNGRRAISRLLAKVTDLAFSPSRWSL